MVFKGSVNVSEIGQITTVHVELTAATLEQAWRTVEDCNTKYFANGMTSIAFAKLGESHYLATFGKDYETTQETHKAYLADNYPNG